MNVVSTLETNQKSAFMKKLSNIYEKLKSFGNVYPPEHAFCLSLDTITMIIIFIDLFTIPLNLSFIEIQRNLFN